MRSLLTLFVVLVFVGTSGVGWSQALHWEKETWTLPVPAASDQFGASVALEGDFAAVGGPLDDGSSGTDAGTVVIYRRTNGVWSPLHQLFGDAGEDLFGNCVALDGGVLVVGARETAPLHRGSASVYDVASGVRLATLIPQNPTAGSHQRFGESVAIHGDTVVVGANGADPSCGSAACGAAYVFVRPSGGWSGQMTESAWLGGATANGAGLGYAVAVHGAVVAAAAPYETSSGTDRAGVVFVYEEPSGGWASVPGEHSPVCRLEATNADAEDLFGLGLAVTPAKIVVGAAQATGAAPPNRDTGAIYLFDQPGGGWSALPLQQAQPALAPATLEPHDLFGHRLAIDGNTLVVGAHLHMPFGIPPLGLAGIAYVFTFNGSTWVESDWLLATAPANGDSLGYGVAVEGTSVLLGAIVDDVGGVHDAGSASLFDISVREVVMSCMCSAGPCGNADLGAGCANSTGEGATLFRSAGTTSVSANTLVLSGRQFPFNVSGLVFMGGSVISVPFGDGRRCAGGTTYRYPLQNTGGSGTMTAFNFSNHASGQVVAGSTWHFQAWYRDSAGPCGDLTNVSNTVSVTFTP